MISNSDQKMSMPRGRVEEFKKYQTRHYLSLLYTNRTI
jgi:hypothetical protein